MRHNEIIISITDIAPANLNQWDESDILRLSFIDIEENIEEYNPNIIFSKDIAKQIIEFIKKFENEDTKEEVVVHCFAGVSRSAGVAKFIAERYGLEFEDFYNDYNKLVYKILKEEDNQKCLKEQPEDIIEKD